MGLESLDQSGAILENFAALILQRSTRTRVSTEAAIAAMGGHPMYLGADQIQLGVYDPALFH